MFSRIKQKYRKYIRLNEAKRYLREHGYKATSRNAYYRF